MQYIQQGKSPFKVTGYTCLIGVSKTEVLQHARGDYQRSILRGYEAWSGATLKGKAAKYSGRYAESRRNLESRLSANFDLVWIRYGKGSRKVLCIYPKCTKEVIEKYAEYQELP